MDTDPPDDREIAVTAEQADAVLAATRVLVALSVESMNSVEEVVDLVQLRTLVILAGAGSMTLGELATAAGLHVSRASRLCDRLVADRLISRTDDPADRRAVRLALTVKGRRVVQRVMGARRDAVSRILTQLSGRRRAELARALRDFAVAGGEIPEQDLWVLGWSS